jgi:hypothetical protein
MRWLMAAGGYEVALRSGQLVCRNAKGKELKDVPRAIKDDPVLLGLSGLPEWLAGHEAQVRADVGRWKSRSLPVPADLLARVWPDQAWRDELTGIVVAVPGPDGTWDPGRVGLFRDVSDHEISVVNQDEEVIQLAGASVVMLPGAGLDDLDGLAEPPARRGGAGGVPSGNAETGPAWLDAGAVLPTGAAAPDDTTEALTARAYRHPVLADRVVVRLVQEITAEAEDLLMEFLRFERPEPVAVVGVVRRQAAGFAGWAMVNDPPNADHALAVVKEIARLAQVAKWSRMTAARDGFDAVAKQLARSVPGFLPVFYEEAARAFQAAGSQAFAAAMFGKAREAERAGGLPVDEDRAHAAFLESALAGSLSAAELSEYSRDLAEDCAPGVAYELFYQLCVKRILAGLAPHAKMHADLRRLAKGAGLGQEAEERLIADIRGAPVLVNDAPQTFWKAYGPALARLARRDPAVSGWLLSIFPCEAGLWLGILEEAGATAALTGPAGSAPPEAESPDGPAGWLSRFDRRYWMWHRGRVPALLSLVERMAARLAADGVPFSLCTDRNHIMDLDLVDLCLTLGVPLTEVPDGTIVKVENWLADPADGRRDLSAVAAHKPLQQRLAKDVENYVTPASDVIEADPERVRAVAAVPGLRAVLHGWLDMLADTLASQGLPGVPDQLDRVSRVACPEGLAANPEAIARIAGHDLGAVLGRTLRSGVMDEYHWPALETAVARIGATGQAAVGDDNGKLVVDLTAQWPALIVSAGDQAAVVGSEVELEHACRLPAGSAGKRRRLRYADGQLLVSLEDGYREGQGRAYWSGAADRVFTLDRQGYWSDVSVALPDGGRTAGDRPLRAGDRSVAARGMVVSDGCTYWTWTECGDRKRWHEYDPATGNLGRHILPAFFADGKVDGQLLEVDVCRLLPAPTELAGSPLGWSSGLIGWRVRQTADGGRSGEGIDGRSFELPGAIWEKVIGKHSADLVGVVRFPGSDAGYGVVQTKSYHGGDVTVCAGDGFEVGRYPTGTRSGFAAATPVLADPSFWHYLAPRDDAGSAALRACSDDLARTLLQRAAGRDLGAVTALVRELLPQVSDPALATGIAGVVRQAATSAARLAGLREMLADHNAGRSEVASGLGAGFSVASLPPGSPPTRPVPPGGRQLDIDQVAARGAGITGATVEDSCGLSDHNLVRADITPNGLAL